MVCKEDVLSWFKDLDSYKRIDVLYDLLNMCLPFELRFLGSCVEEIGKHSYQELRGPAILANDYEKLSKDSTLNQSLNDDNVRHRILIYLSLLNSRNYVVANWLYKNYLRTECIEELVVKNNVKSESLLGEFLLLYTMALHHPAFTFEQKLYFSNVVTRLSEYKENRNRYSPKLGIYTYPPGFGYPAFKTSNVTETSSVPQKGSTFGDVKVPMSGLHPIPNQQQSVDTSAPVWTRPGIHCGAPEAPPFPSAISPLVSQAGTPTHSRSTSPHRANIGLRMPINSRPPLNLMQMTQFENLPQMSIPPPQVEIPPHSSLPIYQNDMKIPDDELSVGPENQQLPDNPWATSSRHHVPPTEQLKQPNGLCYPPFPHSHKMPPPYLLEQMQSLNLEGENALHRSSSSSNSSLNQSPPETPTVAPPSGPGRGNSVADKPRANGFPAFVNSMCDAVSPPPPVFTACTVPYTTYFTNCQLQPNVVTTGGRSMFQYSAGPPYCHRPINFPTPANAPYPQNPPPQPDTNSIPYTTIPYVSILYSSPAPVTFAAAPQRHIPTGCYNCGSSGHQGQDCTEQNIEEITQKKSYTLEYSTGSNSNSPVQQPREPPDTGK